MIGSIRHMGSNLPTSQKTVQFSGISNWPSAAENLYTVADVELVTRLVRDGKPENGINDALRAMFLLATIRNNLVQATGLQAQGWANSTVKAQAKIAQEKVLPAAKALAQFFTVIAEKIEASSEK